MSFRESERTPRPTAGRGLLARLLSELSLASLLLVGCDVHGISAPGELASIRVSPNATLLAGATQQMTAVGYDADGRVMGIAPAWSVAASGGVISEGGIFTAGTMTGLFANTVVASVGSIEGRASIIVIAGALATITVVPTPVTLTVLATQQFTAVGRDVSGNIVPVTPTWSVIASGGSIDQAGMFTAGGTAGTFTNTVQASSGSIKGYATVIVTSGPVASVVVNPNPATLAVGTAQQFTAVVKDASGNVLAIPLVWSVAAGGGTIDATTGLFTAGNALGTYTNTVKATSGSVSGTATVTVVPGVLATITVTPNPATMAVGGSRQLTAVGRDAGGNIVSIAPTWDVVTASNGASITQDGLYTAGTVVGTFPNKVRASSGGIAGYATMIVTTGVLTSITVTPNPVFLPTAGTQQFTAVGNDASGNVFVIAPNWTVVNGGGSIDPGTGLFTAGLTAGTFAGTVVATSGTISGSATVNVGAILSSIVVSPTPVTVQVGGTQQFSALGRDMAGSQSAIVPVWSVVSGGGSIDATTGVFTAGSTAGTFTSTVRATIGAIFGTATVTVTPTPPTLASLTVFPGAATMLVNGTQQFEAVGRDALGNLFPSAPVWRVINGGGSIDAITGWFTAGTVTGTFVATVEARMGAVTGTATVTITAVPPVLATITVTPTPQTLVPGGVQQFTAVGTDALGSVIAITPTWSINAGGGTISGSGFFTAGGVAGTFSGTVVASSGSISGFATVIVSPAAQTITFAAPATPSMYGTSFTIAPTASSGLPVSVTPSGGCTMSGSTVTMTSGTAACVLTASQAGSGGFTAAPNVVQTVAASLRVASVTPTAAGKAFGAADPVLAGALVGFLAGDAVTATYSRVAGEAVGTYVLSATLLPAGVLGNYAITYNTALFTIGQVAQTITFAAPVTPATYGSTFTLAPTASSGLTVTVTPSGGCTMSGLTVTMTSGTTACVLTASQAGTDSFTAAAPVVQTVAAATRAASVTPTAAGKAFGAVDPALTGTLIGFLAGDAVTATYSRVAGEAVGTYVLSATLAPAGVLSNYAITYNTALFTIGQVAQTITFAAPPTPATYGSTFAIAPTASSGLAVTVTPSGGCTLSGSTVTMTSGTTACVLTASQAGNGSFTAAAPVVQTVAAATRAASVTPAAAGKLFGAADPSPITTGTLVGFLAGDGVTATYARIAGEAVGTYVLSATLAPAGVLGNYAITYNTALFTIGQVAQTITFAAPPTPATYGSTFAIAPTASSGLAVTVTPSGGCTLSGSTVTMTSGSAACVLTASQAGNGSFTAAPDVVQTVAAAARAASVTPTAAGKAFGAVDPALTGTLIGFLAGDAVTATYSRVAGEAVGTYVLSATLLPAGVLGNYAITYNTALFTIGQVAQTITFTAPATPATYGSTFTIAPTASSGLTVTVTPSGGCTMSGLTVTMTSGTTACVLTASQAGNGSFTAAAPVVQTVAAAARAASVTPTAAGKAFGAADPALTGTLVGFLAGDAVTATYSRVAGEAVGTYVLSATLLPAGVLGNYAITYNTALFTIGQVAQAITFAAPSSPATYGSTFTIAPTASSGLAVTVTPSGGCTMSGSTVTMTSGTTACVLTASQAGNGSFTAAADVVQTVVAATRAASVTPTAAGKAFGAVDPVLAGTLVGFLVGDNVTATYSRVAGDAVGTYVISATLAPAGVLGDYAITYNTALFTIGQVAQTITFAAPPTPATYGSTFTIAPTASSGLAVTVTPSGGCTLSGSTVTMTSGTTACVLTASQAGNGSFTAAAPVVQTVAAATRAASVTPTAAGKAFGAVDPALAGTLVGFLVGDNVTATYSRVSGEAVGTYVLSATLLPAGVLGNYAIAYNTALFTIGQVAQSITFAAPPTPATYGSTFAIAPTASSGLAVTVTPSGGCTLSGSTVTMTSGTTACVLTASQAGNGSFTAAAPVVQTVVAATRAASVTPTAAGKAFGAADPSPITTGTLVGFLAGDAVTATYSRVAGEAVGTYVLSATLAPAGVLGNYAITYNTALFTIGQVAQAITFAAPVTPATYGSTFTLAPTASSGLTVTVTPSGGCTLSGSTVTMTSGTTACVLTASQAGNGSFTAAPDVVQTVAAATRAASVTPTAAGKAFGAVDPALAGTLVGFLVGDNVTATYSRVSGETVGTYVLSATLAPAGVLNNYTITYNTALFTIGQVAQTITFAAPATPATYGSTFAIAPTASSGLTVTVTPSGGCTLSGSTVTMTSGTTACVLTASQAGNGSFTAAPDVVQTVAAALRAASVTPTTAGKAFGAVDPALTGTLIGFLAGDAVTATYSRVAGEAVATYVISATLAPAGVLGNYAITYNTALFTIGQAAQTITFAAPVTPATYGGTFTIAPTASSGLAVTVTPSGGCTMSGLTVTMTSGTTACVLTASQAGNGTYTAASDVVQTVAASPRTASVTPTAAGKVFGAADPSPITTGTLVGFLAGDNVTATYARIAGEAVGTYVLSATLLPAGVLGNYAITYNTASFTIGQAAQAITFGALSAKTYGDAPFVVSATGGASGNVVTFAASPAGVCTVSGTTVTLTGAGTCTVTASQAGSANYSAAPDVVRTFTVAAAAQAAVTLTVPAGATVGEAGLTAVAGGGSGTGAFSYASTTPGVCTVGAASGSIAALTVGTCSLTAVRAADANYLVSATSAAAAFTITKAAQAAVTVTVPSSATVGEAGLTAVAAGGSGTGAYSYASTTPSVCTVDAVSGSITALTVGSCGITATRATDANYLVSATSAVSSFTIGLGASAAFAVLGGDGASSCTGASTIAGSVGVSASGSMSGFPAPCVITAPGDATVHLNDATAAAAQANVTTVYASLASMACTTDLTGQDLGTKNLAPGVYCFSSSAALTGTLTLTGPSDGVWVFKIGSTLTTAGAAQVAVVGGSAANVNWQVGSSATLGGTNGFRGNIIAQASITLGGATSLTGRALARTGAVILDTNAITLP